MGFIKAVLLAALNSLRPDAGMMRAGIIPVPQ